MQSYILYILRCNNNSLYTGITNNLDHRLKTHMEGNGSKYVNAHLPFQLVYTQKCVNKSTALKKEIQIKKLTKEKKEQLILLQD